MPGRARKPREFRQQIVPLLLLGVGLVITNSSVTFLDGEASILGAAMNPLRTLLAQFFSGAGNHRQPPLYGIVLHFWLSWSGGYFEYLRIASVFFFLAGLFLLGRVGRHLAGSETAATAVVWAGVLWPFGFLFGRLATSEAFSFLLVSGLTLSYFKFLEKQTPARWGVLLLFCGAVTWTSYFGWAILGCLLLDQILRFRSKEVIAAPRALLGTAALVCVFFIPLFHAFRSAVSSGMNFHQRAPAVLASLAFHVFSLFVSESMAPWFWQWSVPVSVAIVLCLALVVWRVPRPARRFLYYAALLIILMAAAGLFQTRPMLLLSPWVVLSVGLAIDAAGPRWASYALAAGLLVIAGVGWYGIYSRRYFSALPYIEPWQQIAEDTSAKVGSGAKVISDQPAFLFYLTYDLRLPPQNGPWRFKGLLPAAVRHPRVYSPADWLASGHPTSGKFLLIRAGEGTGGSAPIDEAMRQLDQSCGSISSRLQMRDTGYKWKQRFFPNLEASPWGIEIREYECDSSNSKQIYPIPPR